MNVIVFGAGIAGKRYCTLECSQEIQILVFADNHQKGSVLGHPIIKPEDIHKYDYDKVIIAIDDYDNLNGIRMQSQMLEQLRDLEVPDEKIFLSSFSIKDSFVKRIDFLCELSNAMKENRITGAVAECGVLRGHFASYMNMYFPDRKLYLFDSFDRAHPKDIEKEYTEGKEEFFEKVSHKFQLRASAEISLLRCLHREKVIIKVGYVPGTFSGVDDTFAFVNLDMDLYAPTLASLRFFIPRMVKGGVILLHDYYVHEFAGIKKAVTETAKEFPITVLPIGDKCSVALVVNMY